MALQASSAWEVTSAACAFAALVSSTSRHGSRRAAPAGPGRGGSTLKGRTRRDIVIGRDRTIPLGLCGSWLAPRAGSGSGATHGRRGTSAAKRGSDGKAWQKLHRDVCFNTHSYVHPQFYSQRIYPCEVSSDICRALSDGVQCRALAGAMVGRCRLPM